jgi:hypothetical protein
LENVKGVIETTTAAVLLIQTFLSILIVDSSLIIIGQDSIGFG